jgi:hypothetical protein
MPSRPVVEATSDRWSDLLTAVDYAKNQAGVSVVSMSWGSTEYRVEAATDATFTTAANHPVTFVTAAGDYGSPPSYPATSPNVLSVGGTTLTIAAGNAYGSETAWSDGGGGVSMYEKEPAFQDGAQNTGFRSGVDVAYDADPNTGFAVYDTINAGYGTGWIEIGGTSAGTPQWSALLAIADEGLAAAGKPALADAQARLYSLPANAFHDVTTGNNGTYAAGSGYDAVTGLGTPVANVLIADLVAGTTGSPTGVSSLKPLPAQSNNHSVGSSGATRRAAMVLGSPGLEELSAAILPLRNAPNLSTAITLMPSVAIEPIAKMVVVADAPQVIRLSGGDLGLDLTSAFSDDNDWLSDGSADSDLGVSAGRASEFDLPPQTDSFVAQIGQFWEGEAPAEPFFTPSDA